MLFLSSTAFILIWFDISIFIFLKFIILGVANDVTSGSANSFVISGKYFLRASVTDTPFHSNAESLLEVFAGSSINYYIIQRISSYGGFQDFYIRFSLNNGQSWSDWTCFVGNMPTFYKNYNSLSALASAIGVVANISPANDDIKTDGLYFKTIYEDETGSYPSSKGIVFSIVSGGDIGVSLFIPKEGETSYKLYIKYLWGNWGNSWTAII